MSTNQHRFLLCPNKIIIFLIASHNPRILTWAQRKSESKSLWWFEQKVGQVPALQPERWGAWVPGQWPAFVRGFCCVWRDELISRCNNCRLLPWEASACWRHRRVGQLSLLWWLGEPHPTELASFLASPTIAVGALPQRSYMPKKISTDAVSPGNVT